MKKKEPASINESIQSMGGIARAESLTAEERKDIARKAAQTRWSPDIPKATHEGIVRIGAASLSCAVVEGPQGPQRLLTQSDFMRVLGRARQAKGRQYYDADVNLPAFLTAKNLKPFISKDLEVTSSQIEFRTTKGARAFGYAATLLPKVCGVFMDADDAGALTQHQKHIGQAAKILIRALAGVAMDALVDEATGYQEIRDRLALQEILDQYIGHELAKWVKRFPDEFYREIFRLKGWTYDPKSTKRPLQMARITCDLVFDRIGPGLTAELKERRQEIFEKTSKKTGKLHQVMTPDVGHPALQHHLSGTIFLAKAFADGQYDDFHHAMDRVAQKHNRTLLLPFPDGSISHANGFQRPS
jgi:hypothetical protein